MDSWLEESSSDQSEPAASEVGPGTPPSDSNVGGLEQHANVLGPYRYNQAREPHPEYISPYPPLRPSCGQSAGSASVAATSMQVIALASSATTRMNGQDSEVLDNDYTSTSELRQATLQFRTPRTMFDPRTTTQAQKQALIAALNERRINTIGELRRVERIFAALGSPDLTQPMTAAWVHYVNSNSLLTELRGITRNYPFSSECLDEAKSRVHQDPESNSSWNYCWLVLAKIQRDRLIPTFARVQASRKEMWGGKTPPAEGINQLTEAFVNEWSAALAQLLRYWEQPPTR